jgi:hypothetical protein
MQAWPSSWGSLRLRGCVDGFASQILHQPYQIPQGGRIHTPSISWKSTLEIQGALQNHLIQLLLQGSGDSLSEWPSAGNAPLSAKIRGDHQEAAAGRLHWGVRQRLHTARMCLHSQRRRPCLPPPHHLRPWQAKGHRDSHRQGTFVQFCFQHLFFFFFPSVLLGFCFQRSFIIWTKGKKSAVFLNLNAV